MDWIMLVFGVVLGSCVTTALVWFQQRGTTGQVGEDYFPRIALSVVLTSLVVGALTMGIEYMTSGTVSMGWPLFAAGWLVGGLLGGWIITGPLRRT